MRKDELKVTFDGVRIDLPMLESKIAGYMNGVCYNLLQVGRCLVYAKEANLVPHGQWESWVRDQTGMSERRAQRLMQAVSLAPEGSVMSELPVSKIMALLPLPEEQREEAAAEALAKSMTVRQLQARVAELTDRASAAEKATEDALHARKIAERKLEIQSGVTDQAMESKAAAEKREELLERRLEEAIQAAEEREAYMRGQLNAAKAAASDGGISAEAQARIDDLQRQVDEAEEYAAQQADLRQQLQQEMLNNAVGGGTAEVQPFSTEELIDAVRSFLGSAGVLPHMGPELSRQSDGVRQQIRTQIDMVREWTVRAYDALSVYTIEADREVRCDD